VNSNLWGKGKEGKMRRRRKRLVLMDLEGFIRPLGYFSGHAIFGDLEERKGY